MLKNLSTKKKMHIAGILNNKVLLADKVQYLTGAIKIYAKSVFDALCEENIDLMKFPEYELQIYEDDSVL